MKRFVLAGSMIITLLLIAWLMPQRVTHANSESGSFWSPPELAVSDPETSVGLVDLVRGPDGTIHVLATRIFPPSLLYARRDLSGNWSPSEEVTESSQTFPRPVLLVTPDGVVHVIWAASQVYYSQRDPSGNWSSPELVSEITHSAQDMNLVALADNKALAGWTSDGDAGVFMRYQASSGDWANIEQVDSGLGFPTNLSINVDGSGNTHFFWADVSGSVTIGGAYHRLFSSLHAWEPETRVSDDLANSFAFVQGVRAVIEGTHLYLAWSQDDGLGSRNLHFAENSGAGWSKPVRLNTTTGSWSVLSIHVSAGNVSLLGNQGSTIVTLWTRPADAGWSGEEGLDFLSGLPGAASWSSTLHLVWSNPGDAPLEYRRRDGAGAWSTIEPIDDNADGFIFQGQGTNLDLAWGNNNNIYYSHAEIILPFKNYLPSVLH